LKTFSLQGCKTKMSVWANDLKRIHELISINKRLEQGLGLAAPAFSAHHASTALKFRTLELQRKQTSSIHNKNAYT
jgi:hypothetical protein